jgi:hypothetical protein
MDYSEILVMLERSIKEYQQSVLKMQYDTASNWAETVRKLGDELIEANTKLRGQYGASNK